MAILPARPKVLFRPLGRPHWSIPPPTPSWAPSATKCLHQQIRRRIQPANGSRPTMLGPACFQRRDDPTNNRFSDVGHKLARLVDAFARSFHRVGNVGAVHHASAVEAALGTEHATSFVVNADQFPATALWLLRECYFLSYGAIERHDRCVS